MLRQKYVCQLVWFLMLKTLLREAGVRKTWNFNYTLKLLNVDVNNISSLIYTPTAYLLEQLWRLNNLQDLISIIHTTLYSLRCYYSFKMLNIHSMFQIVIYTVAVDLFLALLLLYPIFFVSFYVTYSP